MRRTVALACGVLAAMGCASDHVTSPTGADSVVVTRTDAWAEDPQVEGTVVSTQGVILLHALLVGADPAMELASPGTTMPMYRAVFGFPLDSIPPGSTITNASITLYFCAIGGQPFAELGALVMDHVAYGDGVQFDTYDTTALESNIATVATQYTTQPMTATVTPAVTEDFAAGRSYAEFRVHFADTAATTATAGVALVGDDNSDCVAAANGSTPTGVRPVVTVTSSSRVAATP